MVRPHSPRVSFRLLSLVLLGSGWACSAPASDGSPNASAGAAATTGGASNGGSSSSAGASTGGAGNHGGTANGGTSNSAGTANDAGSASLAGSSASAGAGGANAGGIGVTWPHVYVTWYGYDDNSCASEAQHTCANIAYPKSDGNPTLHEGATEGKGTYNDPITFASSNQGDGESFGGATINPGTLIYYPKVRKYFIMEDSCLECTQDWDANQTLHVDLWMGPSVPPPGKTMFGQPLIDCEDNTTDSSAQNPTDTIIVDPPANLPVDQTMLFDGTACSAVIYP